MSAFATFSCSPLTRRSCGVYDNCSSGWYTWGRWVLFGAIVVGAILLFILFSCISARRRRKNGYSPYRFTGWAAPGQVSYNPNVPMDDRPPVPQGQQGYYQNNVPPPAYGANQGYYGNPVQSPEVAHQGHYKPGAPAYAS